MIKLLFQKGPEKFIITIDNKVIKYWDRFEGLLWDGPLQYLPPDPKAKLKIITSRNRIPMGYIQLLLIPQEELDEYNKCTNDEELRLIVLKDALKNGCVLLEENK